MTTDASLAQERRARMAAERLLEQKQAELREANRKLSRHALSLSDEIVEQRVEAEQVKSELESVTTLVEIAERRLWDSIETIQDGFAVFNSDDVMIAANPAYLLPFEGLTEVLPGITYRALLSLAANEGIVDVNDMTRADWIDHMLWRWHQPRVDPLVVRLWNGVSVKLIDKRSRDGDMVSLALNITDTIRNEAKLRDARHKAEAANRAKSAFLANMSHEIRTPMNGVVAMADLMAEGELDEEQRLYVETIKSSGQALLVLINDVLDYSKIEAEKLTIRPLDFDLEQTIHDVATMLQTNAQQKDIDLLVDYDLFLNKHLVGDPGRIRQVLTNLVGNGIKFTNSGHVLIRAVGLPSSEPSTEQLLLITVEDTGIGIPPEKLNHIFGEFNQVEDERNRRYDGTGLGLAITKQLINLMGGDLWVESEVGTGSSFGFKIALKTSQNEEEKTVSIPTWVNRVIIADQHDQQREILAKPFLAKGVQVLNAASLADLAGLDPRICDVVLLARNMVDEDIISSVSALNCPAQIVLLSSAPAKLPADQTVFAAQLQRPVPRNTLFRTLADLPQPTASFEPVLAETDWKDDPPMPMVVQEHDLHEDPSVSPYQDEETLRRMRILAVDDNKTNRFVFGKLLKDLVIDLTFATNGLEAVEKFLEIEPDIIFMDISMPVMDGKEATRQIRSIEAKDGLSHTTIVALTAHAMDGDDKGILAAGLDHYLTKPFVKPAILDRIKQEMPSDCLPVFPD